MARLIKSHQNLGIHLLRWSHAVDEKCLPLRGVENHRPLHVETRPPSYVLIHHLSNTPVGPRCARAAAYPSDPAIRAQIRVRKRPVQSWISSALIAPKICLVVVRIGEFRFQDMMPGVLPTGRRQPVEALHEHKAFRS